MTKRNKKQQFVAYVDGGCPGNGRSAQYMFGSYVVYEVTGMNEEMLSHDTLLQHTPFLENLKFTLQGQQAQPMKVTNNVAEALSLQQLLIELVQRHVIKPGNKVIIFCDSDLVINQVTGGYKVKQPHLKVIHGKIQDFLKKYQERYDESIWECIQLVWISGETMKETRINH